MKAPPSNSRLGIQEKSEFRSLKWASLNLEDQPNRDFSEKPTASMYSILLLAFTIKINRLCR